MDKDSVGYLLHRRKRALDNKKNWESILQKTYRYSQPNRNMFDLRPMGSKIDQSNSNGQNINWYVFDDTLSHATDVYVNRKINALTPPGKNWLDFVPGDAIYDEDIDESLEQEIKKRLQKNTKKFFNTYIHRTNFQLSISECFYDMTVSTGFLLVNPGFEDKQKIVFDALPVDKTYADEGPYGTFDAFYRDWTNLPKEHAEVMWPGINIPNEINEDNNKPEENEVNLYEIIYKDYKSGKWNHCIIEEKSSKKVFEDVHNSSPIIGFRAKKLSGEVYGRGPALDAMPAAATINQAIFDELMAANFKALPIYMGFGDGVFNPESFKMVPNTVIACSPIVSGQWPIHPLPQAGDIQWANLLVNELREQVNKRMLTSPFGAVDDPRKTATEIIERQREVAENAAAQFSRLQRELFDPLVERIVDIMRMNGDWDDPKIDGEIIAVEYDTPLVVSQGQKEVLDFLQQDTYIKQLYGEEASQAYYNNHLVTPWMAQKLNINLDLMKNSMEIADMLAKAAEMQQQQIEAEQSA